MGWPFMYHCPFLYLLFYYLSLFSVILVINKEYVLDTKGFDPLTSNLFSTFSVIEYIMSQFFKKFHL